MSDDLNNPWKPGVQIIPGPRGGGFWRRRGYGGSTRTRSIVKRKPGSSGEFAGYRSPKDPDVSPLIRAAVRTMVASKTTVSWDNLVKLVADQFSVWPGNLNLRRIIRSEVELLKSQGIIVEIGERISMIDEQKKLTGLDSLQNAENESRSNVATHDLERLEHRRIVVCSVLAGKRSISIAHLKHLVANRLAVPRTSILLKKDIDTIIFDLEQREFVTRRSVDIDVNSDILHMLDTSTSPE